MNIYEFAKKLNGREYLKEITKEEEKEAKESGLVVVFGYSDDSTEFRGAIDEEISSFNGAVILLDHLGVIDNNNERYERVIKANSKIIEALWCKEGNYAWTYKTEIPHATFDIYDDKVYCRGIVFDIMDLP